MADYFLTFQVDGRPEPAGSKRAFMKPGARFPVVVDDNPKAKGWKKTVAQAARAAMLKEGWQTVEGACYLSLTFFVERPRSHFRTNGELSAEGLRNPFPAKRPDTLKLARAVEDALTDAGAYADDALVVSENLRKQWGGQEGVIVTLMDL